VVGGDEGVQSLRIGPDGAEDEETHRGYRWESINPRSEVSVDDRIILCFRRRHLSPRSLSV
jgi:hypothetical protein